MLRRRRSASGALVLGSVLGFLFGAVPIVAGPAAGQQPGSAIPKPEDDHRHDVVPPSVSRVTAPSPVGAVPPPAPTLADFDTPGTPYTVGQHLDPPPPTVTAGGSTGNFMRIATAPPVENNSVAFDRTAKGAMCRVTADFDFRITPIVGRADGMAFTLLETGAFGTTGTVPPQGPWYVAEEPNFARSLGIGFDIYQSNDIGDIDNNHVSVHFDGQRLVDVPAVTLNLAGGQWIHAQVVISSEATPHVSVSLRPSGGSTVNLISAFPVPGLTPYEGRAYFGARSGGESANQDLDNVNVTYLSCPSLSGQWSEVMAWPSVAIDAHLQPDGKVLFWDRDDYGGTGAPRLWNPATGGPPVTLTGPGYDLFCAGHTSLWNGKLFAAGGHAVDGEGLAAASIFDPSALTWSRQADMNAGRWYPTTTALANRQVLTVAGTYWDGTLNGDGTHHIVNNTLPQVFVPATGTWRNLTAAALEQPLYPYMYAAPNGRVFDAGPQQMSRYLDTSGAGSWANVAPSSQGFRDYGSSVMYDAGRVMVMGGSVDRALAPTASTDVINLTAASPAWTASDPMNYRRRQHNAVALPTGDVLVVGGTSAPGFNNATGAVFAPEIWDPATGKWSAMAAMQVPRLYHSTALLLPDGRVLVAGGGHPSDGTNLDPDHPDAELYSPPYLFNGPRPTISSAPTAVRYGTTFTLGSPNAASVASVSLIRLGSVTHGFDQSQRFLSLPFSVSGSEVRVSAPATTNDGPPGHYMAFLVNGNGVPSVASILRIDGPTATADLNGDTDTDRSVFRPSTSQWFAQGTPPVSFGQSGDIPVPADYDGDGTIDVAVFRPAVGGWYVQGKSPVFFGLSGDIAVPGDYDGDGRADFAVFRPGVGGWYIQGQSPTFFGLSGDIPVPGDYNGDGKTDISVFRPSVGGWYRSGAPAQFFGLSSDIPVPDDYDGDGRADVSIFRPGVGGWYRSGAPPKFLGLSGDVPVPGDYDGNGVADIAVYRAGAWFVEGQATAYFGVGDDWPLPLPSAIHQNFFP